MSKIFLLLFGLVLLGIGEATTGDSEGNVVTTSTLSKVFVRDWKDELKTKALYPSKKEFKRKKVEEPLTVLEISTTQSPAPAMMHDPPRDYIFRKHENQKPHTHSATNGWVF